MRRVDGFSFGQRKMVEEFASAFWFFREEGCMYVFIKTNDHAMVQDESIDRV